MKTNTRNILLLVAVIVVAVVFLMNKSEGFENVPIRPGDTEISNKILTNYGLCGVDSFGNNINVVTAGNVNDPNPKTAFNTQYYRCTPNVSANISANWRDTSAKMSCNAPGFVKVFEKQQIFKKTKYDRASSVNMYFCKRT
jgi:hypothetical protein